MNRPKLFKALRISWSVAWGVAAVLLCAMWVRSYTYLDSSRGITIASWHGWVFSWHGRIFVHENFHISASDNPQSFGMTTNARGGMTVSGGIVEPAGSGVSFAYWYLVVPLAALAAAPWFHWRFSLRTLLIATTLVTIGLGTIIALTR